jgi:hypothetical protein
MRRAIRRAIRLWHKKVMAQGGSVGHGRNCHSYCHGCTQMDTDGRSTSVDVRIRLDPGASACIGGYRPSYVQPDGEAVEPAGQHPVGQHPVRQRPIGRHQASCLDDRKRHDTATQRGASAGSPRRRHSPAAARQSGGSLDRCDSVADSCGLVPGGVACHPDKVIMPPGIVLTARAATPPTLRADRSASRAAGMTARTRPSPTGGQNHHLRYRQTGAPH